MFIQIHSMPPTHPEPNFQELKLRLAAGRCRDAATAARSAAALRGEAAAFDEAPEEAVEVLRRRVLEPFGRSLEGKPGRCGCRGRCRMCLMRIGMLMKLRITLWGGLQGEKPGRRKGSLLVTGPCRAKECKIGMAAFSQLAFWWRLTKNRRRVPRAQGKARISLTSCHSFHPKRKGTETELCTSIYQRPPGPALRGG